MLIDEIELYKSKIQSKIFSLSQEMGSVAFVGGNINERCILELFTFLILLDYSNITAQEQEELLSYLIWRYDLSEVEILPFVFPNVEYISDGFNSALYYTKSQVDELVENIVPDLTNYYDKPEVDTLISAIPSANLLNLAKTQQIQYTNYEGGLINTSWAVNQNASTSVGYLGAGANTTNCLGPGVLRLAIAAGAAANKNCGVSQNTGSFRFGNSWRFVHHFNFTTAATASQNYSFGICIFGNLDFTQGNENNISAFSCWGLRSHYDVISNKVYLRTYCRTGSSVVSAFVTNFELLPNTDYYLEMKVIEGINILYFYCNGELIDLRDTNIPNASTWLRRGAFLSQITGNNSFVVDCEEALVYYEYPQRPYVL